MSRRSISLRSLIPAVPLLIAVVLLGLLAGPSQAGWFYDEQIPGTENCQTDSRSVVMDQQNNVHMTWYYSGHIFYKCLQDSVWTDTVDIGSGSTPFLAVAPDGVLHLVWSGYYGGRGLLYYMRKDSAGWGPAVILTPDLPQHTNVTAPGVAVDPYGQVHVVWADNRRGSYDVHRRRLTGQVWSDEEMLATNNYFTSGTTILFDVFGNTHVFWNSDYTGLTHMVNDAFGWSLPTSIGRVNGYPAVAADLNGSVHNIFPRDNILWWRHWENGQWSEATSITPGDARAGTCSLTADKDGNLHCVWDDYRSGSAAYYCHFDGGQWSQEVLLGGGYNASVAVGVQPRLAVLRSNSTRLAYKRYDDLPSPTIAVVAPSVGVAGTNLPLRIQGAGFVRPFNVFLLRHGQIIANVPIDSLSSKRITGNIIPDSYSQQLGVMVENPDGQTAIIPNAATIRPLPTWRQTEAAAPGPVSYPDIASSADGSFHLVYRYEYGIRYRKCDMAGWGSEVDLGGYSAYDPPSICTTPGTDVVHVAWQDYRDGNPEIYYRRCESGAWSQEVNVSNAPGESRSPDIVATPSGKVHLVWRDTRNGHWTIQHRALVGSDWGTDESVSVAPANVGEPAAAVGPDGTLYVVWTDDRTGQGEVYFRSCDPNGIWGTERRVTTTDSWQYPESPSIATDSEGRVLMVWIQGVQQYGRVVLSSYLTGGLWTTPSLVPSQAAPQRCRLSSGSDGIVHLICQSDYRQYYCEWLRGGWSSLFELSSPNSDWPAVASHPLTGIKAVWIGPDFGYGAIVSKSRAPTYAIGPPQIASVSPRRIDNFGIHVVAIDGYDFQQPLVVGFGGAGAGFGNFTVQQITPLSIQLRMDLTRAPVGDWNVVVTNVDGQADTLPEGFTVLQSPWSPEQRLTNNTSASSLCYNSARALARDGNDRLHVFWYDQRDGNQEVYHKFLTGDSWSQDERLTSSNGLSADPTGVYSPLHGTVVAWEDARDGNTEIYTKSMQGDAWSSDTRLTTDPAASLYPSMAVDPTGVVHLTWQDSRDVNRQIYYTSWGNGGWTTAQRLTTSTASTLYPSIVSATNGDLYVVWMDDRSGNWEIYFKRWDGTAWSDDTRLTDNTGRSYYPSAAADPSGPVYVTWQDDRDGNFEVYMRRIDAEDTDHRVTNSTAASENAVLAPDDMGRLNVIWGENGVIWLKTLEDGNWSLDHRLTDAGNYPNLLTGPDGSIDVVWRDARDGNNEIYYIGRHSMPASADGLVLDLRPGIRVFPNPTRDAVSFVLTSPGQTTARLALYDIAGRRVRNLLDAVIRTGQTPVRWDGRDDEGHALAPGVYFYELKMDDVRKTGSVVRVE